jgi:methyl-accepting chemotaxis protein
VTRIRNARVGIRLAAAFGLIAVLLIGIVGVAVAGDSAQKTAQDRIVRSAAVTNDLLQMKFLTADFVTSETAYAFDVVRGVADADSDTVGSRQQFLADVQLFRAADQQFETHSLSAAEAKLEAAFRDDFDRFMKNDDKIIAGYRAHTPVEADKASALVLGDGVTIFDDMSTQIDALTDLVSVDAAGAQRAADDAAQSARSLMLGLGVVALAIAGALAVFITRSLTRPLHESVKLLQAMAAGDFRLRVASPANDEVGQMGTAMNHTLDRIGDTLEGIAEGSTSLSSSSVELSAVSQELSAAAEETAAQAASVSAAAEQVSHNVQSVAAGAEELGASIREIAKNTSDAARVAAEAVSVAEATNETVTKLGASSAEIGEVVRVITSIAEQTNLLALNATIEAARAGEAGKGFAVVANEVKDLARKTARSSEEIGKKVGSIQADSEQAMQAIGRITAIIRQINDIQTVIAAAVEEQAATTSEIGRSVTEAAAGSTDIARNITDVAETAQGVTQGAAETHRAAEDLSRVSNELLRLVSQFQLASNETKRPRTATASTVPDMLDLQPPEQTPVVELAGSPHRR